MKRPVGRAVGRSEQAGRGVLHLAARVLFVAGLLTAGPPGRLTAQVSFHAQAIPLVTRAWHTPGDETRTEVAIVQPAVMIEWGPSMERAMAGLPRFSARMTLDGEGLTIPDGELAPGDYGEGFYDRRHPHTYVHELVVSGTDLLGRLDRGLRLSVTAGKGFVAFGSDDPMGRPVVRYPVNHHLAQILERGIVVGSASYGPVMLEGSWFDGDEPTRPSDWPNLDRGLDSRAVRATVMATPALELQYSWARVKSPEQRQGAGPVQRKRDLSARFSGQLAGRQSYALAEWARTEDAGGAFIFHTLLAEAAMSLGRGRPYARFERTERPEEQRTSDPFRSVRPHLDDNNLGTTRWTVWTAGYGVSLLTARGKLEVRPFLEGSVARVTTLEGIFDPRSFYGASVLPSLTLGVRMDWGGMGGMRMGRYEMPGDHSDMMDH